MKSHLFKTGLVLLISFIGISFLQGAAKPKPKNEAFPTYSFENIEQSKYYPSRTYQSTSKKKRKKRAFFKSLFKKKSKKHQPKNFKNSKADAWALQSLISGVLSLGLLGIVVLTLNSLPVLIIFSGLFVIIGLTTGIRALKHKTTKKGTAIAGIVLCGIPALFFVILFEIYLHFVVLNPSD